jgi:hypothetical protein
VRPRSTADTLEVNILLFTPSSIQHKEVAVEF